MKKNLFRITSIIFSSIILISCNNENQNRYNIYHSEYGDFDFLSYTEPKYERMNTNNLIAHSYSYDHNGFSYSAAFYDLDTATISDDLILNNLIGGTIRRANVSTDTIVNITYKGYPGKEAFVYSSDGTEGRIRFILIDNRKVYMLIVTNDGTKSIHNQQVEMFLNSFYIDIEERSNTVESTGTSTLPFGNKLTIRQLIQLLYTDIGYSQDMLIMGGWEPASEFDRLRMINGHQFHVYNFLHPSRDSLILLSVCPFAFITYQPSRPDCVNLRDSIISKYVFVIDTRSSGIRQLYFRSTEDSFVINIHQGLTWFEIWRGTVAVENLDALNKNRLFQEFNIEH